jgi:tRNA 2-selenouridine synthase
MFQDINVQELLELQQRRELQLIDVRSPSEFADFTIPGSENIPLFDDEERRIIGTIYKQISVPAAKDKGLEIVSAKLPAFIKRFEQIPQRKAVFCWRGGMRSKTTATVLSLMGIRVYRLTGGIRAYRQWVHDTLESFELHPKCIVISGHTGTGKTQILSQLAEEGYPVINLESLAQHRGSIFGHIGLKPSNQKSFEALLLHELLRLNDQPYILIEAESKRVGKVVLPEFLVKWKEDGLSLILDMPVVQRVRNIIADYNPEEHKEECIAAFEHIHKRIHTPISAQISQLLHSNHFEEAIELLLEYYYDPRYEYAGQQYQQEPVVCHVNDTDEAITAIKHKLQELFDRK